MKGFKDFILWLKSLEITDSHFCMESTGIYGEALAFYLYEYGHKVSIINPARIKAYARSEGIRNKTDKVDCGVIARFCKAHNPLVWHPASLEERKLKELYRCLQSLQEDQLRISNRLEKTATKKTYCSKIWQELLWTIDTKIKKIGDKISCTIKSSETIRLQVNLLKTIPGIQEKTAVAIFLNFPTSKISKMLKKQLLLLV
jgi:transposase